MTHYKKQLPVQNTLDKKCYKQASTSLFTWCVCHIAQSSVFQNTQWTLNPLGTLIFLSAKGKWSRILYLHHQKYKLPLLPQGIHYPINYQEISHSKMLTYCIQIVGTSKLELSQVGSADKISYYKSAGSGLEIFRQTTFCRVNRSNISTQDGIYHTWIQVSTCTGNVPGMIYSEKE